MSVNRYLTYQQELGLGEEALAQLVVADGLFAVAQAIQNFCDYYNNSEVAAALDGIASAISESGGN